MNIDYWIKRWGEGETGFHREVVNEHLLTFGKDAFGTEGCRILVPMCGKSLDMLWLEEQGHEVVGIEVAEQAVRAFFEENGRAFSERRHETCRIFESGAVTLILGDIFALPRKLPAPVQGIYDRAAYHALESPARRRRYAEILKRLLAPSGRILLLTLDYDPDEMEGPPYAVPESEIETVFGTDRPLKRLLRQDIIDQEPKLRARGCTACAEHVHLIG